MKTIIATALLVMIVTCATVPKPAITLVHSTLIQNGTGTLSID